MTEQATIYCIKTGETIHYIGKTVSETNAEGGINRSNLQYPYNNPGIREVFMGNDSVSVVPIKNVPMSDWYDEKLLEVVEEHKNNHPLLNAQWMLDGKRGYWEGTGGFWIGKTRDPHTLKRLSESKNKQILQFDANGNHVKTWDSGREAALEVFGDYRVVKGAGKTSLYSVLRSQNPKTRFKHGSYWFWASEFKTVPKKIFVKIMYWQYRKNQLRKQSVRTHHSLYTIEHYVRGKVPRTFDNAKHAAHVLGVHHSFVRQVCNGRKKSKNYDLRYGPKKLQLIHLDYGKK